MLAFSNHTYLPLAAITMPFWNQLLRESAAAVQAAQAPAAQSAAGPGPDRQKSEDPTAALSWVIPPECAQMSIQTFSAQVSFVNQSHAFHIPSNTVTD